jgi:hypothetical protein
MARFKIRWPKCGACFQTEDQPTKLTCIWLKLSDENRGRTLAMRLAFWQCEPKIKSQNSQTLALEQYYAATSEPAGSQDIFARARIWAQRLI